ncbi:thaumatin-like protein 1b [Durio zibethinus]|uniref:Thaumatin-like protein 1b n=1 Tax=Durio zibethinus TaxID=66656 RepID=A0A6P5YLK8_DURZI|nr:thaumatin-like protein 1b [Durio zibethinus]
MLVYIRFPVFTGAHSSTFTIVNECSYTVWPGMLSGAGTPQISPTGFILQPGESTSISAPTSWSGRLWGRTLCTEDSSGKFYCLTGDCGSSTLECAGAGAIPPATLAEFTLNGFGGLDFYDVSLVDGYNLPMMVTPHGGTGGNCTSAGCAADLNGDCPLELKVVDGGEGVACKSACDAFGDPQYCCSGTYATPNTCKPSSYSQFFKTACPTAYSYAYDDGTSTFTCAGADYVITFCPTPSTSVKSSNPMAVDSSAGCRPVSSAFIGGAITTLVAKWKLSHLF